MKLMAAIVAVGACVSLVGAQAKKVGWSAGYWPNYNGGSVSSTYFTAYTHVFYFSGNIKAPSANTGKSFTDAVHKGKAKAILCIGGWGAANSFESNSNSADKRTAFIQGIVDGMRNGGFDGVDIDWEEEGGGISNNYTLLLKELRVALDKITPRPLLTIATADNQVPSAVAVKDVVDQMNAMSYWTYAKDMPGYMKRFTDKGVAKSVLGVGWGFDTDDEVDVDNPTDIEAKIKFALDNDFGGVMVWEIARACAKCNEILAGYVDKNVVSVRPGMEQRLAFRNANTISVISNGKNGAPTVRYSVASRNGAATPVNVGLFDARGGLVKTLFQGSNLPGEYSLALENVAGSNLNGAYLIKLTTGTGTQAARAILNP